MDMIIRHVITSIIILFSCALFSQSGWKKTYDAGGSRSVNFDDIQFYDDHLLIRGNAYLDADSIWSLLLCAIDTNGLLLWQQTIFDSTKQSHIVTNTPSKFKVGNNGKMIIPSKFFNHNEIVLFITDSLGQEIASQNYPHSNSTIFPLDVIIQDDHYFIFGHVARNNYRTDLFVIRTDTFGEFDWLKYYGTIHYNELFGDVIDNGNNTFTISSDTYTDNFGFEFDNDNWCRPWIFSIDTAGNMLNQWSGEANDERTLGGGPFYRMSNGDYILLSRDVRQGPFPYDNEWRVSPTITRLDSSYNLVWKKNLTDFTGQFDKFADIEYDERDDTFVAAGELLVWYGHNSAEVEIWVVKFNAEGDIIWNITDTVSYNHREWHFTAGLTIAPSGSIYVAGYVDKGRNEGWILKVTPDGCPDTLCSITSIKEQLALDQNLVRVYPNPANEILYIDLKDPPDDAQLIMYDIMGRAVFRQQLQDTSNEVSLTLPAGLYFYSVFSYDVMLRSGKIVVR